MDFKLLFIVALCVIISSVESETSDAQTLPDADAPFVPKKVLDKKAGDVNDGQATRDPSTTQTFVSDIPTTSPRSRNASSKQSSVSNSPTIASNSVVNSSTQAIVSDQSTIVPDTGAISSTHFSTSDQSTVAPAADGVSSTQISDSNQMVTVAPDTKTNTSVRISDAGSSTGSLALKTRNDTVSTSVKSDGSDAATTSVPNKVTDSDTSKKPEMGVKNVNQTGEDEVSMERECTKVGRFAHPTSCTKYYYCWENSGLPPFEFTCPEHRAFDPITQHCVYNYGVCSLAPKCESDKQVIPNPDDKWTFFQCKIARDDSNEFELHCKACADDREYDDRLGYCKLTSVNGEMIIDSDELTDDMVCGETGLFIDYEDDTKYYECVVQSVAKGILKPVHHKCPIHHVFSMYDRKCVPLSMLARLNAMHKMNVTNN